MKIFGGEFRAHGHFMRGSELVGPGKQCSFEVPEPGSTLCGLAGYGVFTGFTRFMSTLTALVMLTP
jgi:hypothetical protein